MKKSVLFLLTGIFLSATAWAEGDAEYKNIVRPFLAQRCHKCHGAALQKADQRFDTLTLNFHDEDILLTWQNIVDMLNLGLMPPYEEPQPELSEMMPVIDWITAALKTHYEAEESTNKSATGSRIQAGASMPMPRASVRQGGTRVSSEIALPFCSLWRRTMA